MFHNDWTAWDSWMEANDHIVMKGIVPTVEEITSKKDFEPSILTDRDCNIKSMHKFNENVRKLEESKIFNG